MHACFKNKFDIFYIYKFDNKCLLSKYNKYFYKYDFFKFCSDFIKKKGKSTKKLTTEI